LKTTETVQTKPYETADFMHAGFAQDLYTGMDGVATRGVVHVFCLRSNVADLIN
jgi:hypothetical protein